jgi:hypothetical protein
MQGVTVGVVILLAVMAAAIMWVGLVAHQLVTAAAPGEMVLVNNLVWVYLRLRSAVEVAVTRPVMAAAEAVAVMAAEAGQVVVVVQEMAPAVAADI